MRNGKALIDKIEYFMKHPEDEHSFCTMFSKKGYLENNPRI